VLLVPVPPLPHYLLKTALNKLLHRPVLVNFLVVLPVLVLLLQTTSSIPFVLHVLLIPTLQMETPTVLHNLNVVTKSLN
jgi:hypothetical protein